GDAQGEGRDRPDLAVAAQPCARLDRDSGRDGQVPDSLRSRDECLTSIGSIVHYAVSQRLAPSDPGHRAAHGGSVSAELAVREGTTPPRTGRFQRFGTIPRTRLGSYEPRDPDSGPVPRRC